jgi:glutamate--cysteine ligase catalytic subunit
MAKKEYQKEDVERVNLYLSFVLARSKGEVQTGAHYIREFVLNHPEYMKDSIVSPRVAYDLVSNIVSMNASPEQRVYLLGKEWAFH